MSLKHIGCLILFLIGFAVFVVLLLDSICGGCVIDWGEGTVATASHSLGMVHAERRCIGV